MNAGWVPAGKDTSSPEGISIILSAVWMSADCVVISKTHVGFLKEGMLVLRPFEQFWYVFLLLTCCIAFS
jgi:hypothetical protein